PYTQRLVAAAPSLASKRIQSLVHSKLPVETVERSRDDSNLDLSSVAEKAAETSGEGAPAVIEFQNVTKVFNIRGTGFRSLPFTAVDDISFKVPKGSTMALVGESGSGKSTAANLLLSLQPKTSGKILVNGKNTDELNRGQLLALRRKMQ